MRAARLIVVTNRQPDLTAAARQGNSGGLVAALVPAMDDGCATWLSGKPAAGDGSGAGISRADARDAPCRSVCVEYPAALHDGYYAGFSNGILWPLYHSMPYDSARCRAADWEAYAQVNQCFARGAAAEATSDSFVWIHDYQLSLVPALLRQSTAPAAPGIGFFLHTPFPGYDVFRTLPWAREILRGMLAADLVGFHTQGYRRNFCDCIHRLLGVACAPDATEVRIDGRTVKLRAIPVGIDTRAMYRMIDDPTVQRRARRLRQQLGGELLLLGVDRMDYTKGIDRRIEAVNLLLERHPELRGRFVFAQIAVPSRVEIDRYQELRARLEQLAGGANSRWGCEDWSPIKLLCRSYPMAELASWYLAADIGVVTPLRDGMNLVAKEYCAAHRDQPGVLVLSELAGAADELGDALLVNPYDLEALAEALYQALAVPRLEATARMRRMNRQILRCDSRCWADTFLAEGGWARRAIAPAPA